MLTTTTETAATMTMMMLRSGWKASIGYPSGWRWFHRAEDSWDVPYAVDTGDGRVFAWAHRANGVVPFSVFSTVREAHAYLIESGSESPWEEVS